MKPGTWCKKHDTLEKRNKAVDAISCLHSGACGKQMVKYNKWYDENVRPNLVTKPKEKEKEKHPEQLAYCYVRWNPSVGKFVFSRLYK